MPQGERSVPLSRSRGAALGAPLVTFPATGKSPGCRAWLCHALAERPHTVGRRGPRPCSSSPGGTQYPLHLYPEKPKKLHPTVQPNRKKNKKKKRPSPSRWGEPLCMLRLTTHQHVPSNATCDPGKIIVPQLLKIAGKSVIITKLDCIH